MKKAKALLRKVKQLLYRVVTHHRPDDDELVAIRIIELWGANEFPGVIRNLLITVDAGIRLSVAEVRAWLAGGHVLVGTGGPNVVIEEHGKGDGKSAATYAAEHYHIENDPALKPILAYSLLADDRALDHPFAMATLVKTMHAAGVPVETVRAIHRVWFDSLYLMFGDRYLFTDSRPSLQQMAIAWLLSEYGRPEHRSLVFGTFADAMEALEVPADDVDELREIARFVDRDHTKSGYNNFDLAGLCRAMQVTGAKDSEIMEMLAVVLRSKVRTQRDFLAALRYFSTNAAYLEDTGSLRVAIIRSDNEQMQKAARKSDERLNILAQFRSDGYMQIFSDQQRDLRPILARLRMAEYRKSGRTRRLTRDELFAGGTHPRISAWYGFEKYGKVIHIFCGSLKTRRHRKTRLTEREVVGCILEGATHVHRARGVRRDRREQTPSASAA